MDYMCIGKNITKTRLERHLTQEQLAEKANVSTVFISQIETSLKRPSLDTIIRIAKALDTTVDSLLGNDSLQAHYDEIAKILEHCNGDELQFIAGILREICSNIKNGKIIRQK